MNKCQRRGNGNSGVSDDSSINFGGITFDRPWNANEFRYGVEGLERRPFYSIGAPMQIDDLDRDLEYWRVARHQRLDSSFLNLRPEFNRTAGWFAPQRREIIAASQSFTSAAPQPLAVKWRPKWHFMQTNSQQLLAFFAALVLLREQHGPRVMLGRPRIAPLTDFALALMGRWLDQQQQSQQLLAIKAAASMSEKDTGSDEENAASDEEDTSDDDWEMVDGELGVRELSDDEEGAGARVTSRLSPALWAPQDAIPDSGSDDDFEHIQSLVNHMK